MNGQKQRGGVAMEVSKLHSPRDVHQIEINQKVIVLWQALDPLTATHSPLLGVPNAFRLDTVKRAPYPSERAEEPLTAMKPSPIKQIMMPVATMNLVFFNEAIS